MNERKTEQFPIEIFRKMCHGLFQTEKMQATQQWLGEWMREVSVEFCEKTFKYNESTS